MQVSPGHGAAMLAQRSCDSKEILDLEKSGDILPPRPYFSNFITVFHQSFGNKARHRYSSLASPG
mgnify:CR=1 FL=1